MRLFELYNNLSTNKLFELNKNTLKSYVKKAGLDKVNRASSDSYMSGKAGDAYNKAEETKRDYNRDKGIETALNKLANEDMNEEKPVKKSVVKSPTPRNFVAKNSKKSGAGPHDSKKYTRKEKYKYKDIDKNIDI